MAPFFGPCGASSSVSNPAPDDRQIAQRGQRFRAIGLSPGRTAGCWPCGVKGLGGSNPPLSAKQAAIYVILWRTPQPPIPPAAWQDSIGILHDQFHISANFAARFLSLVPGFGPPCAPTGDHLVSHDNEPLNQNNARQHLVPRRFRYLEWYGIVSTAIRLQARSYRWHSAGRGFHHSHAMSWPNTDCSHMSATPEADVIRIKCARSRNVPFRGAAMLA